MSSFDRWFNSRYKKLKLKLDQKNVIEISRNGNKWDIHFKNGAKQTVSGPLIAKYIQENNYDRT